MSNWYKFFNEEGPCQADLRDRVLPPLELEVIPLKVLTPPMLPTLNSELNEYDEAFILDDLFTILKNPV